MLLAVTVIGVLALRRQTAAEFPSASTAELGARTRAAGERVWQTLRGGGSAVRGRVSSAIAERGGAGSGAAASGDRLARLERLVALRDAGALTDEEFAAEKAAVMGAPSQPPAGPDAPTAPLPRPDGEPPTSG